MLEVVHHGLQPALLLAELLLELLHDLYLHLGLRRALVVQDVTPELQTLINDDIPPPPLTVSNVGKTPELSGSEHRNQPTYKPRGCTGDAPWHSHSSVPGPAHKYFLKFSFYGSQLPPPPLNLQ